jgi:hypothetical protein
MKWRACCAHVSTCHGPLQPRVMCACHRTSPTATTLARHGLYAATAAEQRGPHYPKLVSFMARHCGSGATAANLTERWHTRPTAAHVQPLEPARLYVRPAVTPRQTKTLPRAPKPMTLGTQPRQRRSPPANKKNDSAAKRRGNEESSARPKRRLQCTHALSDQAT